MRHVLTCCYGKCLKLNRWLIAIAVLTLVCTLRSSASACLGDCDDDGFVRIDELIGGVSIALQRDRLERCEAFDGDTDRVVSVDELLRGLRNALTDCAEAPKLSGNVISPEIDLEYVNGLPLGGLAEVGLYDLSFNEIGSDDSGSSRFSFDVEAETGYILFAFFNGGQVLGALSPPNTGSRRRDISLSSEVAFDLIVATERAFDDLLPHRLSRPLHELLADADEAVARLNAFLADRNTNRDADRVVDAVRSLTVDQLNQGLAVVTDELDESTLRAYGAGLGGIRTLKELLEDPQPPLNPHFTFSRKNASGGIDFGMSDLENLRWDYLGDLGISPDIVVGGSQLLYIGRARLVSSRYLLGVFVRPLGTSQSPRLVTGDLHCVDAAWAPDESRIAASCRPFVREGEFPPYNIFVVNADGSGLRQFTFDTDPIIDEDSIMHGFTRPSWSPDGSKIIFQHLTELPSDGLFTNDRIDIIDSNGANHETYLEGAATGIRYLGGPVWSPDGRTIFFHARRPGSGEFEIMSAPYDLGDELTVEILTASTKTPFGPSVSYNGRNIIYSALGDGTRYKVFNRYTGEIVDELGDFAKASNYGFPRFTGTEVIFTAVEGVETDDEGNVVVGPSDDRTTTDPNGYNYYRETIPAANNLGINFNVTSWW